MKQTHVLLGVAILIFAAYYMYKRNTEPFQAQSGIEENEQMKRQMETAGIAIGGIAAVLLLVLAGFALYLKSSNHRSIPAAISRSLTPLSRASSVTASPRSRSASLW